MLGRSMDIETLLTTHPSILPVFFNKAGSKRGLALCKPLTNIHKSAGFTLHLLDSQPSPLSVVGSLSAFCGQLLDTLVLQVIKNDVSALLDWLLVQTDQPSVLPQKLIL